jgi:hypothetical protein
MVDPRAIPSQFRGSWSSSLAFLESCSAPGNVGGDPLTITGQVKALAEQVAGIARLKKIVEVMSQGYFSTWTTFVPDSS